MGSGDTVEIEMTELSHDDYEVFGFSNRVDSSTIYWNGKD